jgi:anti-sigma factor RsiW
MSCVSSPLVALLLDGELDARSTLELEQHVQGCALCQRQQADLLALRAAVHSGVERFEMPARLRSRVLHRRRRWLYVAAPALAAAAAVLLMVRPSSVEDEVVSAHARSLMVDHLTDVVSTDQHTVKPWFQGKLDFGVPVRDFAAEGFPLVGGRLDYVREKPVAAVVYKHGAHAINLFVWLDSGDQPPRSSQQRGYNEIRWKTGGLSYWLVSDVAAADLDALARLIRR